MKTHLADELMEARETLLEAVQVPVNVHRGPGQQRETRRDLPIHVVEVRPDERLDRRRQLRDDRVVLVDQVGELVEVELRESSKGRGC